MEINSLTNLDYVYWYMMDEEEFAEHVVQEGKFGFARQCLPEEFAISYEYYVEPGLH